MLRLGGVIPQHKQLMRIPESFKTVHNKYGKEGRQLGKVPKIGQDKDAEKKTPGREKGSLRGNRSRGFLRKKVKKFTG